MKYVALLRGIGPGNPNMRNDKLCSVCENLGFQNVQSVISSGNLVFESDRTDVKQMEAELETGWLDRLGFHSTTVIKSKSQIEKLIKRTPFAGLTHGPASYLLATFCKQRIKPGFSLPYQPEGKTYQIIAITNDALFTVTDNTQVKTTDLMSWLEKEFGKQITSRTWKTVERIFAQMS